MLRPVSQIIADLNVYEPQDGNWLGLDALVIEMLQHRLDAPAIDALLRIFERYPTEDGCEVFWTIVHGLEGQPNYPGHPGYDAPLLASLRRAPSEFGLLLLHRLLNSGIHAAGGIRFVSVLEEIVKNPNVLPELRRQAQQILDEFPE